MVTEEPRSGDLLDVALRDEIELVSDLVVAASASPRHLTPEEVDRLLGVSEKGQAEGSAGQAAGETPETLGADPD